MVARLHNSNCGKVEREVQRVYKDKPRHCSLKETADKFRKALAQSKGRCNTDVAIQIAMLKNSTVDDVVRLGDWCGEGKNTSIFDKGIQTTADRKLDAGDRKRIQQIKRTVRFGDTFIAERLKKGGTWDTVKHLENVDWELVRDGNHGTYTKDRQRIFAAMLFCKTSHDRLKEHYERMVTHVEDFPLQAPTQIWGDESYKRNVRELFSCRKWALKHELEWLNQLPEDTLKDISTKLEEQRFFAQPVTLTECVFVSNMTMFNNPVNMEMGRMAFEALDYMGLGVYQSYSNPLARYRNSSQFMHKGIVPMVKKIISSQRHFNALLKKGFDLKLVREEIILDLENAINGRTNFSWKFFAKSNAPSTYEVQTEKTKRSRKPKVEQPKTITVGGLELTVKE